MLFEWQQVQLQSLIENGVEIELGGGYFGRFVVKQTGTVDVALFDHRRWIKHLRGVDGTKGRQIGFDEVGHFDDLLLLLVLVHIHETLPAAVSAECSEGLRAIFVPFPRHCDASGDGERLLLQVEVVQRQFGREPRGFYVLCIPRLLILATDGLSFVG